MSLSLSTAARALACAHLLLVSACEQPPPGDPALVRSDDPVGVCSVGEAFEPTVTGLTNYIAGAQGGTFLLTCITPGPTGTMVTIAMPGVAALPDTGVYHVLRKMLDSGLKNTASNRASPSSPVFPCAAGTDSSMSHARLRSLCLNYKSGMPSPPRRSASGTLW
jgi:hypothetical protein